MGCEMGFPVDLPLVEVTFGPYLTALGTPVSPLRLRGLSIAPPVRLEWHGTVVVAGPVPVSIDPATGTGTVLVPATDTVGLNIEPGWTYTVITPAVLGYDEPVHVSLPADPPQVDFDTLAPVPVGPVTPVLVPADWATEAQASAEAATASATAAAGSATTAQTAAQSAAADAAEQVTSQVTGQIEAAQAAATDAAGAATAAAASATEAAADAATATSLATQAAESATSTATDAAATAADRAAVTDLAAQLQGRQVWAVATVDDLPERAALGDVVLLTTPTGHITINQITGA